MTAISPAVDDSGSFRDDVKVISLIGVAHFFSHFYILLLPPLFPILKDAFGVSYVELGLFVMAFSGATGVSQIVCGYLVDRMGAKGILIGGLALEGLAFLLIGLAGSYGAGSYWAVLGLMGVAGVANGVYHPADYAILSASVSERRMGRAFSLHTFTGFFGGAVVPGTIILLASLFGWAVGVALCGAAGIAAAAALLVFGRSLKHEPGADKRRKPGAKADAGPTPASVLLSPPILMCLVFFTLLALSQGGINQFLVSALNALYGTPVEEATVALTSYLFGTAGGILIGGQIADRTRHHNRVAATCFLFTAAAVLVVGSVALPLWLLVALMVGQGVAQGIIMPSRDMLVRSVTPPGAMGKVFGFVSTGFSIGGIVSPLLFGFLLDQGQPSVVFHVVAAFMAVSLVTVFTAVGERRRDDPAA
ncbi:MFS transporter [Thalassobaculum fulvum]|uniref:MFS transporter n=1 Tax=Thalassobaculum fulvum TaxID=1633335 RepID=A0A918XS89_9PROT|nr:MFS transporter [Thalassobaculum fulvum]GHD50918.1 MFS transporter [Thalassobaculum fulvum]